MPKIDLAGIAPRGPHDYTDPYRIGVPGREIRLLAAPAGLTDLEVNPVVLLPGAWSSQRHWHEGEVLVAGGAMLRDDAGDTRVAPGDVLAFPNADGNGHHLIAGPDG